MKKTITILIGLVSVFLTASAAYAEGVLHGGDILYTKPVKSVLFSHKLHVEDRGLGCDMCHPKLFELSSFNAQQNKDFNMDAMYKGKYCGACHDGKTAFASNTQCARCHGGVKEVVAWEKKPKPVKQAAKGPAGTIVMGSGDTAAGFSHEVHTKNFGCNECHGGMFQMKKGATKVTMDELYKGKACGSCHNGLKAFGSSECAKCHGKTPVPKADLVYRTEGMGPAKFSHAFHTKAFGCDQCHDKVFRMKKGGSGMKMDPMYTGKYCGKCHNGEAAAAVTECAKCHKQ